MNKKKPIALTFSIQNKGHGTFPRHERMALALKKKGYQVIWISPYGYQNKNFQKIDLLFNFLPNFLFVGIYIKILLTCIFNKNKIENTEIVFGIREYDALALFYNPFFLNCKKVFFSRGDVISILNVNLSDKNIFQKIIDKTIILIYPWLQRLLYLKTDLNIFQANFLAKLYLTRINKNYKKTKILSNNCSLVKKKN